MSRVRSKMPICPWCHEPFVPTHDERQVYCKATHATAAKRRRKQEAEDAREAERRRAARAQRVCENKKSYDASGAARAAQAASLREGLTVVPYECSICSTWHLTSKPRLGSDMGGAPWLGT